jgi:hypothetical protein
MAHTRDTMPHGRGNVSQVAIDMTTSDAEFQEVKADLASFLRDNPAEFSGKFVCVINSALEGSALK